MANKTVYPYGTGGELPSSIGLINDLKTGGVDKALTAEQGKVIGDILFEDTTYEQDDLTPLSSYNDKQFKANEAQVGKALSAVDTYSSTGFRNYKISVKGANSVTYSKYNSTSGYGCLFLNSANVVVSGVASTSSDPSMRTIGIPEGAVWFIWSILSNMTGASCTVSFVKSETDKSRIDDIEAEVNSIEDEIGKVLVTEADFSDLTHFKDGYQLKSNNAQIGKSLNNVDTYQSSGYINVKVPVNGYGKASFRQYASTSEYGSLVVDENDIVLLGINRTSSESVVKNIEIPSNATYLVASFTSSTTDKTVTLYKEDGILSRLDELEAKNTSSISNTSSSGRSPKMTLGRVDSSGNNIGGNYITTETIFGDFAIDLADGWRVYEGHLYDSDGMIVSYQTIHPDVSHNGARGKWQNRLFISVANMVPEFGYRLTFCKSDSSAIDAEEKPVTNFVVLSDAGLHRWVPNDLPNYDVALRRIDYFQHLRWVPLAKVPNGYPPSSGTETTNTYFNIAGRVAIGFPYSDVADTCKYVPNYVSIRTFMTAAKNRRSLLYTEELNNNTSKYGMSYQSGNRRAYFGSVCSGFTAWVMGIDMLYLSDAYGQDTIPGLTAVNNPDIDSIRPLDFIWSDGHISIISDIYKNEFGKVAFVAWAEVSTPYPYRTLYTPEQFATRLVGKTVHRWSGWENLTEPEPTEYSQYLLGDTRREPKVNEDIMTFAGDYAAFAEGDTIYLNARRNSVYTGVELYKNDTLLQTIDITGLSADTIVTPNTGDWVKVNLTTLNLAYGKYKARLTDGTNTTDYTYFEVIDITLSAVKSGNNVVVTIGSTEGVPTGLKKVKANGFPNMYHPITAEEVAAGNVTLSWGYNSTYRYIQMIVKGNYGSVCKKIDFPQS